MSDSIIAQLTGFFISVILPVSTERRSTGSMLPATRTEFPEGLNVPVTKIFGIAFPSYLTYNTGAQVFSILDFRLPLDIDYSSIGLQATRLKS
jgi:hypothetical protein